MKVILRAALVLDILAASAAAGDRCDVPVTDWQPREALWRRLEAAGWRIRAIRARDGCYVVDGTDPSGHVVQSPFDPGTLAPVAAVEATDHG